MKRLVRTSGGWLQLDPEELGPWGVSVHITVFGEGGWVAREASWNAKWPQDTGFESFLAELAQIPFEEAAEISRQTNQGWRARGGGETSREKWKLIALLGTTAFLVAVGTAALLAVLVALAFWLL